MLLALLLAAFLRFYRLDAQSFWNDEGNAARAAERPIPLVLDAAEGDIHPPGYYLILHVWRGLAGESEFALRSLSVVCGVLTVALTYRLGLRLLGAAAGVGGATLASLSPLAIYYSQEARMYAPLGLLSAASTYLLCSILCTQQRDRLLGLAHPRSTLLLSVGYVITAAAGLYMHYTFPFILGVHNLLFVGWWVGWGRQRRRRWRLVLEWVILQGAVLALFLPWLPVALAEAVTGRPSVGRAYRLGETLRDIFRALVVGITLEVERASGALVVAGGLLLVGLRPRRGRLGAVGALGVWLFLPIALTLAFDLYRPAYLKLLLVVLPPFHILVACGAHWLSRAASRVLGASAALRIVAYPLLLALVAASLLPSLRNLYFNPAYARDDYRQVAADLTAQVSSVDAILLNAPNQWEVFTYYFDGPADVYPAPYRPTAEEAAAWLEPILSSQQRLFVLYWGDAEADPQRLIEGKLADEAFKAGDRWYGRVRVAVYGTGVLEEEPAVAVDARFGEVIHLRGYALGERAFSPGDVIPVTLFWEAEAPIPDRYKVFLHLLGSDSQLVAQTDGEPGGNLLPTTIWPPGEMVIDRHGVLLPKELPAGEYGLVVGLYHLVGGERLRVTLDGESGAGHVGLGTVVVR